MSLYDYEDDGLGDDWSTEHEEDEVYDGNVESSQASEDHQECWN